MELFKAGYVAILGLPNSGKSTLLNALLMDDKAIVSEIPGTTRDSIEDTIVIDGIGYRFIDTADTVRLFPQYRVRYRPDGQDCHSISYF